MFLDQKTEHCLNKYTTQNTLQIKCSPMTFFTKIEKSILKFVWNDKGPQIHKVILRMNKTREITHPNIKVCYKVIIITVV